MKDYAHTVQHALMNAETANFHIMFCAGRSLRHVPRSLAQLCVDSCQAAQLAPHHHQGVACGT